MLLDSTISSALFYLLSYHNQATWNCEICNDTCVGALSTIAGEPALTWGYPEQIIPPETPTLYLLPGCYMPLRGTINANVATSIYLYGVARCNTR